MDTPTAALRICIHFRNEADPTRNFNVFRVPLLFGFVFIFFPPPPEVDHCITVLGFWILIIIIIIITLAVAVLLFSIRADFSSPYFVFVYFCFLFYIAVIYIDLKKTCFERTVNFSGGNGMGGGWWTPENMYVFVQR